MNELYSHVPKKAKEMIILIEDCICFVRKFVKCAGFDCKKISVELEKL